MTIAYAVVGFVLIISVSFLRGTKDKYEDLCVGAALPVISILLLPLFGLLTQFLCPVTLDTTLRNIDIGLRLDGFALTRWLIRTGAYWFVPPVYSALPLMFAIAWCLERSWALLRASLVGVALAIPQYLLVPAVGPEYAFTHFPESSGRALSIVGHPRNCFPSMHFTWAFLLALNARNRFWRFATLTYAGLMAIATVAGGEHYVIDVIVAVPFAVAVQWIARREKHNAHETRAIDHLG